MGQSLSGFEDEQVPHIRAGHRIASDIYKDITRFVNELKRFRDNQSQFISVKENHVINELLFHIAASLPPNSVWLGVSHLTVGWEESKADPEYRKFVRIVQDRSKKGELKVMRLYCVASRQEIDEIRTHLQEECAALIGVRTLMGRDVPRDMSLLWLHSDLQSIHLQPAEDRLVSRIRDLEVKAICGMEFHTWQHRSLNKMSLYSPQSDDFDRLANEFDDYWSKGTVFESSKQQLQGPRTGDAKQAVYQAKNG
jgi:hypothetical protein